MNILSETFDQLFCEKVSDLCVKRFDRLGKNGKPGSGEWTVLACILVAEKKDGSHQLRVVSSGTGSKCLGGNELPKNGERLHDSHAEVIAQRAFKLYLLDQLKKCLLKEHSLFVIREGGFVLRDDISFHFYCSSIPCGDAAIFPRMSTPKSDAKRQNYDEFLSEGRPVKKMKPEDKGSHDLSLPFFKSSPDDEKFPNSDPYLDIHRTGAKCTTATKVDTLQPGLNSQVTGVLRTKPGRGDPTLSHCCSDKILKWTVLGIQGSLLMLFIRQPIYLSTISLGKCPMDKDALLRAFHKRSQTPLDNFKFTPPFRVQVPVIMQSSVPFPLAKSLVHEEGSSGSRHRPCAASIIWSDTPVHKAKHEVAVDGKRLGTTKRNENSVKSRVAVCRIEMLRVVLELIKMIQRKMTGGEELSSDWFKFNGISVSLTYGDVKNLSISYKTLWKHLREKVFVHWTEKPSDIQEFVLDSLKG